MPLLSDACLLLNHSLPPHLRRLDTAFPMYAEDVDLVRRVPAAGFRSVLVAESVITHVGGVSAGEANARTAVLAVDGINRYFRRWHGRGSALAHRAGIGLIAGGKWGVLSAIGAEPARRRALKALLLWALGNDGLPTRWWIDF